MPSFISLTRSPNLSLSPSLFFCLLIFFLSHSFLLLFSPFLRSPFITFRCFAVDFPAWSHFAYLIHIHRFLSPCVPFCPVIAFPLQCCCVFLPIVNWPTIETLRSRFHVNIILSQSLTHQWHTCIQHARINSPSIKLL